jgi:hypothetical protein
MTAAIRFIPPVKSGVAKPTVRAHCRRRLPEGGGVEEQSSGAGEGAAED